MGPMRLARDASRLGRYWMGARKPRHRITFALLYSLVLTAVTVIGCRKAPPPPKPPPDLAVPYDVRFADTIDSIEGYRGSLLALAASQAKSPELRVLGQKMSDENLARSGRFVHWRKTHFADIPSTDPLPLPCSREVLMGWSLPANQSDSQLIDTLLLQMQCEALFVSEAMRKSHDVELLQAGHEIITTSAPEVAALLRMKAASRAEVKK